MDNLSLLMEKGAFLQKNGDFNQALRVFEQALTSSRESRIQSIELDCLMKIALLKWNIGEIEESRSLYQQSYELAKSLNKLEISGIEPLLSVVDLYLFAKELRIKEQYQESAEIFIQAMYLSEKINCPEMMIKCLRQSSVCFMNLNQLDKCRKHTEQALNIAYHIKHPMEITYCLNNLGIWHQSNGDLCEALSYYEKSRLSAGEEMIENATPAMNNIANIYLEVGLLDKARECLNEVISIDRRIGDKEAVYMDMINLALVLRRMGLRVDNIRYLQDALNLMKECIRDGTQYLTNKIRAKAYTNLGCIQSDLLEYEQAMMNFSIAERAFMQLMDEVSMAHVLSNKAEVMLKTKRVNESANLYRRALNMATQNNVKQVMWEAYNGLGMIYASNNEYGKAEKHIRSAIDAVESARDRISLDYFRASYLSNKTQIYENLLSIIYHKYVRERNIGFIYDLLEIIERCKARTLIEELVSSRALSKEINDVQWTRKEKELSKQISELNRSFNGSTSHQEVLIAVKRMNDLEGSYIRHLASANKKNMAQIPGLVLRGELLVKLLRDKVLSGNTLMIEYFVGEKLSLLIGISDESIFVDELPCRRELENIMIGYFKAISEPDNRVTAISAAADRIGKEILPSKEIKRSENLIFVPDGILYYIPFESLINSNNEGDAYLIEKHPISYSPSVTSLLFLQDNIGKGFVRDIVAIGLSGYQGKKSKGELQKGVINNIYYDITAPQLPFAKKEIDGISKYFKSGRRKKVVGLNASEKVVKKELALPTKIVHFACHGILDEVNPFRSALVLNQTNDLTEDGFLQVREIYNMNIPADLVVLSACQTGRGRLERGEGMMGLPRIFFQVGARSVISSLWKINDASTAVFMDKFYRHLAAGESKTDALRSAKIEMIQSKYSHPAYWAPFILNGEYRSSINIR